jgi:hypothetical protein
MMIVILTVKITLTRPLERIMTICYLLCRGKGMKKFSGNLKHGHCFRRNSTTFLADADANLSNVKRHGGWKSTSVAEGYIENSIQNKINIAKKIQNQEENTTTLRPEAGNSLS